MPRIASILAALAAAIAMAAPAAAADKAKPARAAASKPARESILSPAQLRECEALREKLRATSDGAVQGKKEIDAERAAIDASAAEMQAQLAGLDRTSQEAIDGYNQRITQRDQAIDAYQARVTAYNLKVVELGTLKDDHEKRCEARRYDERDLADIKKGRK